jgi:hypothetical protein
MMPGTSMFDEPFLMESDIENYSPQVERRKPRGQLVANPQDRGDACSSLYLLLPTPDLC